MFLTEEPYLEGILRNTSNPDYAQFLLVFRNTFNEERHAKRLQICASQLNIEWSPGSEIMYAGRSSKSFLGILGRIPFLYTILASPAPAPSIPSP